MWECPYQFEKVCLHYLPYSILTLNIISKREFLSFKTASFGKSCFATFWFPLNPKPAEVRPMIINKRANISLELLGRIKRVG